MKPAYKIYIALFLVILLLGFKQLNPPTEVIFYKGSLKITEKADFEVEIATSKTQHNLGLMYRKELPKNNGMLFILEKPYDIAMWMKNTYIPLDIIFIDENKVIKKIVKNTKPNSLTNISAGEMIKYVLELNAGISDEYKITEGDKIEYNYYHNDNK